MKRPIKTQKTTLSDMTGEEAADILVTYAGILSDCQDMMQGHETYKTFCEKLLRELIELHGKIIPVHKAKK